MYIKVIIKLLFLSSYIHLSVALSKSHPVTTLINAKWHITPIQLEIAEYIADENPNLLWDFIDLINKLDPNLDELGT